MIVGRIHQKPVSICLGLTELLDLANSVWDIWAAWIQGLHREGKKKCLTREPLRYWFIAEF